jgi:hypothetical protein
MSRKFVPVSKEFLKQKIVDAINKQPRDEYSGPATVEHFYGDKSEYDPSQDEEEYFEPVTLFSCIKYLTPSVEKDLSKIMFDTENVYWEYIDNYTDRMVDFQTTKSGLNFLGVVAGGDWEVPIFFIIYWDGEKLRGYIPEDGNTFNTVTKKAYGNDQEADSENMKKVWGENATFGSLKCEYERIMTDIEGRIVPR